MKITKEDAIRIAHDAMENAGFSPEECTNDHPLWWQDAVESDDYYVQIHKQCDDGVDHFVVCYTTPEGESYFQHTKLLDEQELAGLLLELADCFDMAEATEAYAIIKDPESDGYALIHVYPSECECDFDGLEEGKIAMFTDAFLLKPDESMVEDWRACNGLYGGYATAIELINDVYKEDFVLIDPDENMREYIESFPDNGDYGIGYQDIAACWKAGMKED